ncbi:hypothetical protein [Streptomyces sp. NPDC007905]|uniref:hypothetical protein n=1 Tax=Streptomyces sp. NPDC007905 TaxID=3364788 RepID=UPI0036E7EBBA
MRSLLLEASLLAQKPLGLGPARSQTAVRHLGLASNHCAASSAPSALTTIAKKMRGVAAP